MVGFVTPLPKHLANILRAAARELGILVDDTPAKLDLIDPAIFKHHMLFMHGRQAFVFDDAQRKNLARVPWSEEERCLLIASVHLNLLPMLSERSFLTGFPDRHH